MLENEEKTMKLGTCFVALIFYVDSTATRESLLLPNLPVVSILVSFSYDFSIFLTPRLWTLTYIIVCIHIKYTHVYFDTSLIEKTPRNCPEIINLLF